MTVVSLKTSSGTGSRRKTGLIAALDVGSHKIACMIATRSGPLSHEAQNSLSGLKIIGFAQHASQGIKNGAVVDLEAAQTAIGHVIEAAETQAGCRVEKALVNIVGGRPRARLHSASIALEDEEVSSLHIGQALHLAAQDAASDHRFSIHTVPLDYRIDGHAGVRNPLGMHGRKLGVDLSVTSVEPLPMRNLVRAVEACHVEIVDQVISAHACGMACLVEDEKELGVICIDMGAETSGISVFYEGQMVYADSINYGGAHVTRDIARGLSTPITHAERLKTIFGSALPSSNDHRELITVPHVGEKGTETVDKVPRSMLTGMIQPRVEEILEMLRDRLRESGLEHLAGRRVVLAGGASQLTGLDELTSRILDKHVRPVSSLSLHGLPDTAKGPAYAALAGLVICGTDPRLRHATLPEIEQIDTDRTYFSKIGQWLKESF